MEAKNDMFVNQDNPRASTKRVNEVIRSSHKTYVDKPKERSTQINVNGVVYESLNDAAMRLGVGRQKLSAELKKLMASSRSEIEVTMTQLRTFTIKKI